MNVVVTLTALNEARNIKEVIEEILRMGYKCILVDDGSTDETTEFARACGASVVKHFLNLGQGYAVLTGFRVALEEECDIIVEMDADGQHNPSEIPKFLEKFVSTDADVVVGSRIVGENHPNAPFFRKTFLPHFTYLINRLSGYNMTDALCGFRAFKKASLLEAVPLLEAMLEPQYIAAEMFLRFSKIGFEIEEVPIQLRDRSNGSSYKGLVRYGFGILKAIIKTLLDKNYRSPKAA